MRVSGSTLQGEVTSAAHKMTSSFDPSLRYCWTIVAIGGWGGGPGHRKAIVMAELKPDEEFHGRRGFVSALWSGNTTMSGARP